MMLYSLLYSLPNSFLSKTTKELDFQIGFGKKNWPYILFKKRIVRKTICLTGALNGGTKPFSAAVPTGKQVL